VPPVEGVEAKTDSHAYELTFVDPGGPDDREEFCEAGGRQRQLVYVSNLGRGSLENPYGSCEVAS